MAGFYSILSKGINVLDRNTPEARRRLYERAIAALVAEMRLTDPALNQPEFQVAWNSLKEAIVKIEIAIVKIEMNIEIEGAETDAEAKIESEAEIGAKAEAECDRLIYRPAATTSTSRRRAGSAEAKIESEAEMGAKAGAECDRLIYRPAATTSTSRRRAGIAEAKIESEAEMGAKAGAECDRLTYRPAATTSTSRRRAGIAAASARPAVRLGGQRRPGLMGFLASALRRDPDATASNERKRHADRGEDPSSDFWSEMEFGQPGDNWLSDLLARASRDDNPALKKRR